MKEKVSKRSIAEEYVMKFPKTAKLALARKIYKEQSPLFHNVEDARSVIRAIKGASGDQQRKYRSSKKELFDKASSTTAYMDLLPKPSQHFKNWAPVPLKGERFLLVPDVHIPYYNKEALSIALKYGVDHGADTVVLAGDFMDFYACSFWSTDPRQRDFKGEIEMGRRVLDVIRDTFKDANIYYLEGNHEFRLVRYMLTKAPEIFDEEMHGLASIMKLDEYDIQLINEKRPMTIGNMSIIHGHEFWSRVYSPVNPAKGFHNKSMANVIGAHYHQTSEHITTNIKQKLIGAWSLGCLCDLHPDYSPINQWNHGFGFVEKQSSQNIKVKNIKIKDGEVL